MKNGLARKASPASVSYSEVSRRFHRRHSMSCFWLQFPSVAKPRGKALLPLGCWCTSLCLQPPSHPHCKLPTTYFYVIFFTVTNTDKQGKNVVWACCLKGHGSLHRVGVTTGAPSMVVTACPGFVLSWQMRKQKTRWERDGLGPWSHNPSS